MITGSGSSSAANSMSRASWFVAGASTVSPGTCAYQASKLWECWAASCRPAPVAIRTMSGTLTCPPDICRSVAALLTIWSKANRLKLTVITSTIGRMPPSAAPIPAPTNADSDSGVSRIRSGPNSSANHGCRQTPRRSVPRPRPSGTRARPIAALAQPAANGFAIGHRRHGLAPFRRCRPSAAGSTLPRLSLAPLGAASCRGVYTSLSRSSTGSHGPASA